MADLSDDGLKRYGFAPGNYMSKCHRCGFVVCGLDKRATSCRPCAIAADRALNARAAEPLSTPADARWRQLATPQAQPAPAEPSAPTDRESLRGALMNNLPLSTDQRAALWSMLAAHPAPVGAEGLPKRVRDCIGAILPHVCKKFPAEQALNELAALASRPVGDGGSTEAQIDSLNGLDTSRRVRFYEHDFYVLSNFSSFTLDWKGIRFDTSEAAYHWEKFVGKPAVMTAIQHAPSAHEAFKVAEHYKPFRRPDWDDVKVGIMRDILRAKATQHEYVRRKLLATGDRELVEDSWRDDFWGWGPVRDGQNMLGRLWMEVRAELRVHNITGDTTHG